VRTLLQTVQIIFSPGHWILLFRTVDIFTVMDMSLMIELFPSCTHIRYIYTYTDTSSRNILLCRSYLSTLLLFLLLVVLCALRCYLCGWHFVASQGGGGRRWELCTYGLARTLRRVRTATPHVSASAPLHCRALGCFEHIRVLRITSHRTANSVSLISSKRYCVHSLSRILDQTLDSGFWILILTPWTIRCHSILKLGNSVAGSWFRVATAVGACATQQQSERSSAPLSVTSEGELRNIRHRSVNMINLLF
jgi:hypothetical protein